MKQFIQDITTGRDGVTHDIVRTSMAIIVAMLPLIMLWGMVMSTWSFVTGKPFDLNNAFNAVLLFLTGAGTFLVGGGASLLLKKSTEPDGTVTETQEITKGKLPDTTIIKETVITPPNNQ